jgi:hypothetical protein
MVSRRESGALSDVRSALRLLAAEGCFVDVASDVNKVEKPRHPIVDTTTNYFRRSLTLCIGLG